MSSEETVGIDTIIDIAPLRVRAGAFLDYLDDWLDDLLPMPLESLIAQAGGPQHVAIFCVDVINGFCYEGPLASARVAKVVGPIVELFQNAYAAGVEHFVLTHDAHDPAAVEFVDYPPHCIRGTSESAIVPELMALPFAPTYTILPKNSISSSANTGLDAWLDAHPAITHRVVVGDCTDICAYQLAMHLKVRANAANIVAPVIVPINCVDTYDISVEAAQREEIPAHPADLLHTVFLYNMQRNGIKVVTHIGTTFNPLGEPGGHGDVVS